MTSLFKEAEDTHHRIPATTRSAMDVKHDFHVILEVSCRDDFHGTNEKRANVMAARLVN